MAKRKRKKSKSLSSERFLRYLVWILAGVATLLVLFLVGYYFGYNSAKEDIASKLEQKERQRSEALKKLEKEVKQKQSLNKKLEQLLKKESKKRYDITARHETDDKKVLQPIHKPKASATGKKPKLAIIFDDVSFASQIKAIKALNMKVTMSFFPPSSIHPDTPKLAAKERFYMIHLPMEAMHFHKEEPYTLRVGDSQRRINERIAKIKSLFPRVHYINNHTGSKFTSDKESVERLINVLDRYHIEFIDSRTTAKTQVPAVMKERGRPYMARDVFLDHKGDVASIKKQIALAVKVAKKYGEAIAIGHPHPNTLLALSQSRSLLRNVELVYIYELY